MDVNQVHEDRWGIAFGFGGEINSKNNFRGKITCSIRSQPAIPPGDVKP